MTFQNFTDKKNYETIQGNMVDLYNSQSFPIVCCLFSQFSQVGSLYFTSITMSSLRPAISGVNLTINENSSIFPEILAFPLTATNSVVNPSSAAEPLLSDHCIS